MPGRQAHGRPLLAGAGPRKAKKPKSRATRTNALDAFALAAQQVPEGRTKGLRTRALEPEPAGGSQKRHRRDDDSDDGEDDDDEEENEEDGRRKKRARNDDGDEDFDDPMGSGDDEEWHVGVDADDDDSEIDSDDAFGEEDEERFEGFTFRGSSSKGGRGKDDDENDSDSGSSLGSDAIDLAQALDQASDEEPAADGSASSSEEESGSDESESDEDPARQDELRALISGFAGEEEETVQAAAPQRAKIGLEDLGLQGVKDPQIKKSLKLLGAEARAEVATTKKKTKKLDVPLARRQQDKLSRSAAFDKASETLDRWTDTVKQNRRAEHLLFPLAQNQHDAGLANGELLPVDKKTSGTELEQTILSIMEESGLGPAAKQQEKKDDGKTVSRAELKALWQERRREREMHSREKARAKRIKKIKSKAYHRVHRRERVRDEAAAQEALAEAGEGLDSDEEREAQDRRRAMERMGAKHMESKWAKMGAKNKRAVWDEDYRAGLGDMARMDAELRRRVEGKKGAGSDDDDSSSDSSADLDDDDDDKKQRLLSELDRAAEDNDSAPRTGLMKLKFMQRGEEALKKANDELAEQLRRELEGGEEEDDDGNDEEADVGRRRYGVAKTTTTALATSTPAKTSEKKGPSSFAAADSIPAAQIEAQISAPGAAGAWSRAGKPERRKGKKTASAPEELDLSNAAVLAARKKPEKTAGEAEDSGDESSSELHLPLAVKDQELVKRAFAGEDVVGEFRREKAQLEEDDGDKEVDNTLPGWGSWVGEGVSNRERKRHTGRFVTKVDGVKKKDRKDYKLDRVMVNEKRMKKTDKYLSSQLPHPFESRAQYERSLRLPVGPEWMTKETFQDSTKPRVLLKPGVIAPMSRPM